MPRTSSSISQEDMQKSLRALRGVLQQTLLNLDPIDITVLGYDKEVECEDLYHRIQTFMQSLPKE